MLRILIQWLPVAASAKLCGLGRRLFHEFVQTRASAFPPKLQQGSAHQRPDCGRNCCHHRGLPLSIALALASGVNPEQGLYTAIVAGFLIAALGGSKVQISGPTAAFATIVAGIVARNGMSGLALATIMAGITLVLMGLFKLGNLIRFIPFTITTASPLASQ